MSTNAQAAETEPHSRKPGRPRKVFENKPLFIGCREIAHELGVSVPAIKKWIAEGYFPPQHSRIGASTRVWLRSDWDAFVASGKWPASSWPGRGSRGGR